MAGALLSSRGKAKVVYLTVAAQTRVAPCLSKIRMKAPVHRTLSPQGLESRTLLLRDVGRASKVRTVVKGVIPVLFSRGGRGADPVEEVASTVKIFQVCSAFFFPRLLGAVHAQVPSAWQNNPHQTRT